MSLLDLGEIEGGQETPREYLERTLLLPSLEVAVEQMLKASVLAMERGEKAQPLNVLATVLMRQNPRHDKEAAARLQKHAEAKRVAAAKAEARRSATSAVMADEARVKEAAAADLSPAAAGPILKAERETEGERAGTMISLHLEAGVQLDVCITETAEAPADVEGA